MPVRRWSKKRGIGPNMNAPTTVFHPANMLLFSSPYRLPHVEDLSIHFQPIYDVLTGTVLAFEALTRLNKTPEKGFPRALLDAARASGNLMKFNEMLSVLAVTEFSTADLPGLLFVNVSPGAMPNAKTSSGIFSEEYPAWRIPADRIVIELTEDEPLLDYKAMQQSLIFFRDRGFTIALDDFGEGFSSMRLWTEIKPSFVKIDRHFIDGVHTDFLKQQFIEAFVRVAARCGVTLIAEGIESHAELSTLKHLGIRFGQGYYLGRPASASHWIANKSNAGGWFGEDRRVDSGNKKNRTVIDIAKMVAQLDVSQSVDQAFERFEQDPNLKLLPVTRSNTEVIGLISRYRLISEFAKLYRRELYGKRSCTSVMDRAAVVVPAEMTFNEAARLVGLAAGESSSDGFVVTKAGEYAGICETKSLMFEIIESEMRAARYANPLTLLPGNVPIDERIAAMLIRQEPFYVCYADLDNFKPFNDSQGYFAGDEVIKLTADLLLRHADGERDFVGHVGGDDFIVLFRSPDWYERCQLLVTEFDKSIKRFYSSEELDGQSFRARDRRGRLVSFPLLSLSLGVIHVPKTHDASLLDVSAAAASAKGQAKRQKGSAIFVERRDLFGPQSVNLDAPKFVVE